ncbi:MAG: ATP-binding protein [Candidatus Hodarchaeota archaeon]
MIPSSTSIPFSALVGLSDAKLALILAIIDPKIGGVLISGPKGTGKSTLVRSLYSILPDIEFIKTCPFHCIPHDLKNMCEKCQDTYQTNPNSLETETKQMQVITLPLGATEDRVIGSLDIEKIIGSGIEALSPGILAYANQEILYVDEINLLPDHLVDTILDCSASGWNIVERENISISHPSQFILVGSMNPEEGDLRPQLLDRLSLFAQAGNVEDISERIKIIELNLNRKYGSEIYGEYIENDLNIKKQIQNARKRLPTIQIQPEIKQLIATLCMTLQVDGFRSDIVLTRISRAKAAFEGRNSVSFEDVRQCANLVLLHRTREGGMREPPSHLEITQALNQILKSLMK